MIRQDLNKIVYLIFLFSLVFNQQVNTMSMSVAMNQDMESVQKSTSHPLSDEKNKTIKLSHLQNDNVAECASKTCYDMCKFSTEIAIDKSFKNHPNPVFISFMLYIDYGFNYTGVKLDELYKPPQNTFV
ncbi:MAG: hypothetical protein ACC657_16310 [Thiohalomonadales bacterium]